MESLVWLRKRPENLVVVHVVWLWAWKINWSWNSVQFFCVLTRDEQGFKKKLVMTSQAWEQECCHSWGGRGRRMWASGQSGPQNEKSGQKELFPSDFIKRVHEDESWTVFKRVRDVTLPDAWEIQPPNLMLIQEISRCHKWSNPRITYWKVHF